MSSKWFSLVGLLTVSSWARDFCRVKSLVMFSSLQHGSGASHPQKPSFSLENCSPLTMKNLLPKKHSERQQTERVVEVLAVVFPRGASDPRQAQRTGRETKLKHPWAIFGGGDVFLGIRKLPELPVVKTTI